MTWFRKSRKKLEAWEPFPFVGFAAVLISAVVAASVLTGLRAKLGSTATDLGTLWLLAIAAVVAAWYALETFLLRKEAEQTAKGTAEANTFSALTTIHQQLMNRNSRTLRHLVIEKCPAELGEALATNVGETYVTGASPNRTVLLERVLDTLQSNDKMDRDFLAALDRGAVFHEETALTVIESVLADFDLIAVPHSLGIEAVRFAAQAYKPVLQHTSESLLTFVAIRRKLTHDSSYRFHYVRLLRELKIDTLGVA